MLDKIALFGLGAAGSAFKIIKMHHYIVFADDQQNARERRGLKRNKEGEVVNRPEPNQQYFFQKLKWDLDWDEKGDIPNGCARNLIFVVESENPSQDEKLGVFADRINYIRSSLSTQSYPINKIIYSSSPNSVKTFERLLEHVIELEVIPRHKSEYLEDGLGPFHTNPQLLEPHLPHRAHVAYVSYTRFEAAFRRFFYRTNDQNDKCVMFICPQNLIRFFIVRALQSPKEAMLRFELPPLSLTFFKLYPLGNVILERAGERGHIL